MGRPAAYGKHSSQLRDETATIIRYGVKGGLRMLSRESLEHYRRMAPSQRLAIALRMTRESIPYLS